jgi:hypothetical protein
MEIPTLRAIARIRSREGKMGSAGQRSACAVAPSWRPIFHMRHFFAFVKQFSENKSPGIQVIPTLTIVRVLPTKSAVRLFSAINYGLYGQSPTDL